MAERIPDDVMEAARAVVDAWLKDPRTTTGVRLVSGYRTDALVDHIAAALYAERKRAAEIARNWSATSRKLAGQGDYPEQALRHHIAGDMADDIATAILAIEGGRE